MVDIYRTKGSQKEINNDKAIEDIINKASVLRMGLAVDDMPYVVPLCFGYLNRTFYIHSAKSGKKLDMIRSNNSVCIEIDGNIKLLQNEEPCSWSMNYASVIAFGRAYILESRAEKEVGLNSIMQKYSRKEYHFREEDLDKVTVIKIVVERITGKMS